MNLADLTAKLQANRKALGIAGAAGVAGLALYKRRQAGGDAGTGSPAGSGGSLAAPNGQVVYSSEASDVYNAIQPQLETIGQQLGQLLVDKSQPSPAKTIPVPAPPKATPAKPPAVKTPAKAPAVKTPAKAPAVKTPAKAKALTWKPGFYKVAGTDLTYLQDDHGNLDWLSKAEGNAYQVRAGQKNAGQIHVVAKDSTFWDGRKYLGGGPNPNKLK